MSKSKAFLFAEDDQLGSRLCLAMAHPARFLIMSRLVRGGNISYEELIAGIPLERGAIGNHLNIITREGFVRPVILADGSAGYALNRQLYITCVAASRRSLRDGRASIVGLREGSIDLGDVV